MTERLEPVNSLETMLKSAQEGHSSFDSFIDMLMTSDLFAASTSELLDKDTSFVPMLFDREGVPMLAVFTDKSRASLYKEKLKSLAKKTGEHLLLTMPKGYGVVINPGFDVGLEILPEGVENLLQKRKA